MDIHQSHLQEDGTTFPPLTRDAPQPPGVDVPTVPELMVEEQEDAEEGPAPGD
jgi:hypothetical protein